MKQFTLLFNLLLSFLSFGQTIIWEDEIKVANGNLYGNIRPRLSLNREGVPMVLMTKGGSGKIFFSKYTNSEFSLPLELTSGTMNTYIATWTGPDMAAHGDTVVVVFKLNPFLDGRVYAVRSTDGGATFSDTMRVDSHAGMAWLPSMTMDTQGNPLVTYMAHDVNLTNPKYVYVRSNDGGVTYENEKIVSAGIPGEACDCCPSEMAASEDFEVLVYRNNEADHRDIYAISTADQGQSFPFTRNIDEHDWIIQSCPSTGPHSQIVGSSLYTTYVSGFSGKFRVFVSVTNLTDSSAAIQNVALPGPTNPDGFQNYPRLAIENGMLALTWTEAETNNSEIFASWAPLSDLNQLVSNKQQCNLITQGVQTNPDIQIINGWLHLIFQDSYTNQVTYKRGQIGFAGLSSNNLIEANKWFPNPAIAQQDFKIPVDFIQTNFEIIDQNGAVVFRYFANEAGSKTISGLGTGAYFVKLEGKKDAIKWVIK